MHSFADKWYYSGPHESEARVARGRSLLPGLSRAMLGGVTRLNPYMLMVLAAFYLATWHLVDGRYPIAASYAPNVLWAHEWTQQFRQGILYPRWMEHPYSGLGTPTFGFYGPLCMYMTLPFTVGLGASLSYGVLYSFWLALLVMGLGVARLVRAALGSKNRWLPALIGSMAILSPYALLNVYPRGALAETWAMALLPWLLAAVLTSLTSTSFASRLRLVICTSLFALCHPPSLLLGATAIGFALLVTLRSWSDVKCTLRRVILPIATGFAVDAFYLLSAIRDQRYVNIKYLTTAGGPRAMDRLLAFELGRFSFKFAEGFDGSAVPMLLFGVLILLALPYLLRRFLASSQTETRRNLSFLAACGAAAAFMMTDLAKGIYELLPVFNTVQFTYRWMVVFTISVLPLWGFVILTTTRSRRRVVVISRIPIWLATAWMSTSAFAVSVGWTDWNKADAVRTDALFDHMDRTGQEPDLGARPFKDFRGLLHLNANDELVLEDVSEYHPFAKSDGQFPARTYGHVEWQKGEGTVSALDWRPMHRRFTVDSKTGGELLVRTTAWLGWQVTVNRESTVGDESGDWGRMLVRVPPGHSQVRIDYVGTPNQQLGVTLTMATLAALLLYGTRRIWFAAATASRRLLLRRDAGRELGHLISHGVRTRD